MYLQIFIVIHKVSMNECDIPDTKEFDIKVNIIIFSSSERTFHFPSKAL